MKLILIRHGKTKGNEEKRYLSKTDEELSMEGEKELLEKKDFLFDEEVTTVYVSPLKRCKTTAKILYPQTRVVVIDDLKECDFGEFEYKNYMELDGNKEYQRFIDSGGVCGFPGGENKETFTKRIRNAFEEALIDASSRNEEAVAFVVHGGSIMAIMEAYAIPSAPYFSWQIKNSECFIATCNPLDFMNGNKKIYLK